MNTWKTLFIFISIICQFFIIGCGVEDQEGTDSSAQLSPAFSIVPVEQSKLNFDNRFAGFEVSGALDYTNVYNGGGVAIADINNDGLDDIYFTGNNVSNKLFVNRGDLIFEDISSPSGTACEDMWSNGATWVDINNDGFEDLYVSMAYSKDPKERKNKLFINNGDLTFSEKSEEYGVADDGYSIQSLFLDFDKDGDPDLFVGNHPRARFNSSQPYYQKWLNPSHETSDRLYRNNGDNTFTDITAESGILNFGFTLSMHTSDFNEDGWPDIFVAVDHGEPDLLYINQQDGTFKESVSDFFRHISASSMGCDIADINNDGLMDVFVADMLASDNFREKTQMGNMDPDLFWRRVDQGYHLQYMRNMLQLNAGNGQYSEIGQMLGVSRTDWSWATLFFDYDNDTNEDLFVSNGYYRDIMDKDLRRVISNQNLAQIKSQKELDNLIKTFGKDFTSTPLPNKFFKNNGGLDFEDNSEEANLNYKGFSSGAAYSDLDNDGDVDLVVNNIDDNALLYENTLSDKGYLQIIPAGYKETFPEGAQFNLTLANGTSLTKEAHRVRGYASAVGNRIYFGFPLQEDSLKLTITWPDGKIQVANLAPNQIATIPYKPQQESLKIPMDPIFVSNPDLLNEPFHHQENQFDDFGHQVLLPHKMSMFGPYLSQGDVNNDGLSDIYIGGASGQEGRIYVQDANGQFIWQEEAVFERDKRYEDLGSVFLDVDNDGDQDLYVVSGGNEFEPNHGFYQDRLYVNDQGTYRNATNQIPSIRTSGGRVIKLDINNDSYLDLIVAGRHRPHAYPVPTSTIILLNEADGNFRDATDTYCKDFLDIGLITDLAAVDINNDEQLDLVLVGEWTNVMIFIREADQYINRSQEYGTDKLFGWWNKLITEDFDGDGDQDIVLGNLGLNYKYQATPDQPFEIYSSDFDGNGSQDIVLGYYLGSDVLVPVRGLQCSSEQLPILKKKFATYTDFGQSSLNDIYGEALNNALHYQVTEFRSGILENDGGKMLFKPFPNEAQIFPIQAMTKSDVDRDGDLDLIVAGNLYQSEVETGRADAGNGLYLRNDQKLNFHPTKNWKNGLYLTGDIKDLQVVFTGKNSENFLFVGGNNQLLRTYRY